MNKLVAFSWYGGKTSHLKWLLPIINNTPHFTYVEPFGGSAAALLNKCPSPVEIYNDLYKDVVNFFSTLRNNKEDLISLLELTPYSREEFAESCKNNEMDSNLEMARKFFIRARQVRMGLATTASEGRWAYVKKDSRRGMSLTTSRWLSGIDGLEDVCERLKTVQLENLDALDIINRYDTDETLYYIDPPYLMNTRSGGIGYAHEFPEQKHLQLLSIVNSLKGKVILSGYPNELYDNFLKEWNRHEADAKLSASTRQNGKSQLRQEIIWTNYDIERNK